MAAADAAAPAAAAVLRVLGRWRRARATELVLPHYVCRTPMFMPVGTQGTVKALSSKQLEDLNCQVILGNTYHLGNRPGPELLAECVRARGHPAWLMRRRGARGAAASAWGALGRTLR